MRFTAWLFTLLLLLVPFGVAPAAEEEGPFHLVATVAHPPITEMSGIAKRATYEDVYWVHNDSGDTARLFAIDGEEVWEGLTLFAAWNVDWEDIAVAGDRIYVAETGNDLRVLRPDIPAKPAISAT